MTHLSGSMVLHHKTPSRAYLPVFTEYKIVLVTFHMMTSLNYVVTFLWSQPITSLTTFNYCENSKVCIRIIVHFWELSVGLESSDVFAADCVQDPWL